VADVVLGIETSCDENLGRGPRKRPVGRAPELASLVILSQDVHRVSAASSPSWRAARTSPPCRAAADPNAAGEIRLIARV